MKPNFKILFSGDHSYHKKRDTTRKAISECVESTYENVEMDLGIFEDLDNSLIMNLFDNVVVECEANNFVESLGENVEEITINGNVEEGGQDETDTQIVQRIKEGIEGHSVVVYVEENDLRNNGGDDGRVNTEENEEWGFQINEENYEVIAQENVREGDEENVEGVENVQDNFGGHDENVLEIVQENLEENEGANEEEILKRSRKRKRDEIDWKKNIRKRLKNSGKEYQSVKGTVVAEKEFRFFECKCMLKCNQTLLRANRETIHSYFYKLSDWSLQTMYIKSNITVIPVKRKRTENPNSKRSFTRKYFFPIHKFVKMFSNIPYEFQTRELHMH